MAACSVVIPVHGGAAHTKRCVDTLLAEALDDTEIIVVDDGSDDLTQRLVASYGDRIRGLRNERARGFGPACNRGAAAATGDHVVFLNNDTVPRPGWLAALRAHAAAHPAAGAVGARLLFPDGRVQHAGVCIRQDGRPHHLYAGFPGEHPVVTRSRRLQVVTGACMLVPRSVFAELGGFDEAFSNGSEDIDLCLRMGEHGYEVHYCADAVVEHLESVTRGTSNPEVNELLFARRWQHRAEPDELRLYLEDGLLGYRSDRAQVELEISPLLGVARITDGDELADHLLERAEQVVALRQELSAVRGAHREAERVAFAYGSNGGLHAVTLPDARPAPPVPSLPAFEHLRSITAPLELDIAVGEPPRVNLLLPELDPQRISGSAVAALQLASALAAAGRRVRLVTVDRPAAPVGQLAAFRAYDGLLDVFDRVEIAHRGDAPALRVSPRDTWIATTWWTAHIADAAARAVRGRRFVYLVQEYEPLGVPAGSFAALAEESYRLPHAAIFSSVLLRDWFAERGLGSFGGGAAPGVVLESPLVDPGTMELADLRPRGAPGLLLHARPAATEARDLLELALLGLEQAADAGALAGWSITAVGLPAGQEPITLASGLVLDPLPRQSPMEYRSLLRGNQVGVALLHAPHPGLVPVEMAAAGMSAVTTTYGPKTAERLTAISSNILGVEPTVAGVRDGVLAAVGRAADLEARRAGADVRWSRRHASSFDPPLMAEVEAMLNASAPM